MTRSEVERICATSLGIRCWRQRSSRARYRASLRNRGRPRRSWGSSSPCSSTYRLAEYADLLLCISRTVHFWTKKKIPIPEAVFLAWRVQAPGGRDARLKTRRVEPDLMTAPVNKHMDVSELPMSSLSSIAAFRSSLPFTLLTML